MFQQTYFHSSSGKLRQQQQRCSVGDLKGIGSGVRAISTPDLVSSLQKERERFGLGTSIPTPKPPFSTRRSTGDTKNAIFWVPSKSTDKECITASSAGAASAPLNLLGSYALPSSLLGLSKSLMATPQDSTASNIMRSKLPNRCRETVEDPIASSKNFRVKDEVAAAASDTDTATTASISTAALSSPTPSLLSNASSIDDESGAEDVEFLLDAVAASDEEELPVLNFLAELGDSEGDHDWNEDGEESSEGDCDNDGDEIDLSSCCTPILKNTFREQLREQQNHSTRSITVSRERRASMTTTTTTETKTMTTTTTQTTTALDTSESVISTSCLSPRLFSKSMEGQQNDAPLVYIPNTREINGVNKECNMNCTDMTTTSTDLTDPRPHCECCDRKQQQIDRQEQEMEIMKGTMKKLCLLLTDALQSQEAIGNGRRRRRRKNRRLPPGLPRHKPKAIADRSREELSPRADNKNKNQEEGGCDGTELLSPPSSLPPARRRISSLAIRSIGKDCPRSKNQRIQVNGQWGTYSGPSLESKDGKGSDSIQDDTKSSSCEAGILQGCVVRLDEGDLYVGNLSRNDTGSITFHPPGTLYDSNRKPIRRIR